jgi:hypothetical protein
VIIVDKVAVEDVGHGAEEGHGEEEVCVVVVVVAASLMLEA